MEGGYKIISMKENDLYTDDGTKTTIEALDKHLAGLGEDCIFRAQSLDDRLTTSMERACVKFDYDLEEDAPKIEKEMVRQFARVYDGIDSEMVRNDKLYCLSLMRHFGAPTRLLDFTYSRYVAIYFALEYAYKDANKYRDDNNDKKRAVIWSIDIPELLKKVNAKDSCVAKSIRDRVEDDKRNDTTFKPLYWYDKYTFVCPENPVKIHKRLDLQQGVFLCPGNVRKRFEDNLFDPYEKRTEDIHRVIFEPDDLRGAFEEYYRMNLTRESLFPGLDGLAQSMEYHLWLYRKLHDWREDWRKGFFRKDEISDE